MNNPSRDAQVVIGDIPDGLWIIESPSKKSVSQLFPPSLPIPRPLWISPPNQSINQSLMPFSVTSRLLWRV
jgi:hypothetical protein